MKKLLLFLLLFSCAVPSYAYDNTYAVIIGIADYKYDIVSDLKCTLNDARSFSKFLMSKEGGSVPAKNICLLTESNAARNNIIRKAKALFSKAGKNDRVIFYFSGHGDEGFFVPYDYNGTAETTLFYSDIKSIFKSAKSNTKLLFLDACFSGGIKGPSTHRRDDRTSSKNLNIAVMSASRSDEVSWESDKGMGVFTYYLMQGLGGAANLDGNGYITIQELYYYVYKQVTKKTQSAEYSSQQTPQLFGKFDLRLIVGKVQQ